MLLSTALRTTAPAPSPKSTHTLLSFQLTISDIFSEPITSAYLYEPAFNIEAAISRAVIKPEHAALTSKHIAFTALSFACTSDA